MKVDFTKQAKKMDYKVKKSTLLEIPEVQLHGELKTLFERMSINDRVEVTHGPAEKGRDLVIKRKEPWGDEKFIGVIVKKGDSSGKITGEIKGPVSEILEQGRLALSTPCTLTEIAIGPRKTPNLVVIFVGRLTTTASERVVAELNNAEYYPIDWLIKHFEQHYPEFFFHGQSASFIQDRISLLDKSMRFQSRPSLLSSSYINPLISKYYWPSDLKGSLEQMIDSEEFPFSHLEEIVDTNKSILLVGDAGTGKSTALTKLAYDMFSDCLDQCVRQRTNKVKLKIPLLIRAIDLISKQVEQTIIEQVPDESIASGFEITCLLVDGLDEVKPEHRDAIIEKANSFCREHSCGLVISSRKIEALEYLASPLERYEILPFKYEQAVEFIRKAVPDNEELFSMLEEGIQGGELKIELTPMALNLLIEIATVEREIPATLTEIYERYVDIVTGRFDSARGIESAFSHWIKKGFLAELAWQEFFLKSSLSITKETFWKFVESYLLQHDYDKEQFHRFLAEIDRAGLLQIDDLVFFRHRSFLEYFSAYRLDKHREEHNDLEGDVVNLYYDPMWNSVAFYYIGIRRKVSEQLIDRIHEFDSDDFDTYLRKILIGRLLQAGWDSSPQVKRKALVNGLEYIAKLRIELDEISQNATTPIAPIFVDFMLLFLSEYSFGSRTLMNEVLALCDELSKQEAKGSLQNCIFLLFANRKRLPPDKLSKQITKSMTCFSQLELAGKLSVREKFATYLILEQIESADKKLIGSLKRKLKRIKKQYPEALKKLLPLPEKGIKQKKRKHT